MNEIMEARFPSTSVHWINAGGYIKGRLNEPVCGIADKVSTYTSVNRVELESRVTCEHCLYWLWDQKQPARKMDIDQRVVNMRFDNKGLSAHDTELAIQRGSEAAIERGIREGLAKVASDFRSTKPELGRMVEDAVERALQRGTVRTNLVGIAKIADDEIDAEWDKDNPNFEEEVEEKRRAEIRAEVHNALDERAVPNTKMQTQEAIFELFEQPAFKRRLRAMAKEGAAQALLEQSGTRHHVAGPGVGTVVEFTQNVYSPEALTPSEIYRQGRNQAGTTVVNVNAEVDPESFKEMVKEAAREYDEETLETYNEEETALMQKAVASIVASDQFQDLFKKLVKDAITEKDEAAHLRAMRWQLEWYDRAMTLIPNVISDPGDVVEVSDHSALNMEVEIDGPDSYIHYRRLYRTDTACYLDANKFNTTIHKNRVTCKDCKDELNIN